MKGNNSKSDVKAKAAFISGLETRGFQNAKVISSPCDISAEKDDTTFRSDFQLYICSI